MQKILLIAVGSLRSTLFRCWMLFLSPLWRPCGADEARSSDGIILVAKSRRVRRVHSLAIGTRSFRRTRSGEDLFAIGRHFAASRANAQATFKSRMEQAPPPHNSCGYLIS